MWQYSMKPRTRKYVNPHVHKIIFQRNCMKWVPGDPQKEMLN